MGRLQKLLQIREGEGRTVALVTTLAVIAIAGSTLGESAASALFFDRVGADALPVAYLLQAVVVLIAMLSLSWLLGRVRRARAYVLIPAAVTAVVIAERVLLPSAGRWLLYALWVTVTLASLLQGVFLWGAAGLVTDTRQAKRLFPLFGAGGIFGSVVAGVATPLLASALGAPNLLLLWAASLVAGVVLTRTLVVRARAEHAAAVRTRRRTRARSTLGRSPFLVWMTIGGVLFSILFYLLYLPYAKAAAATYPDADELASFFGLFWAAVTGASFVVSILASNRLLRRLGVTTAVLILPVLYVGGFGVMIASAAFATLVAVRFVLGTWLQSVASPAWESLINVTPLTERDQVRAFLNGGPTQVGTAVAGVVGLIGQRALSTSQLAVVGLILSGLTVAAGWKIRGAYTGALVAALRAGRPTIFTLPIPGAAFRVDVDADSERTILEHSRAEDAPTRRLTVDLLSEIATPAAIDRIRGLRSDRDPDVRRRAVRALGTLVEPSRNVLREALDDRDVGVRATAASLLLDDPNPEPAFTVLESLLASADPTTRVLTLNAIRETASARAAEMAARCLGDPDGAVRREALRAVAAGEPDLATRPAIALLRERPEPAAVAVVGRADASAIRLVVDELERAPLAEGLLAALSQVEGGPYAPTLEWLAHNHVASAQRDETLSAIVATRFDGDPAHLLADALRSRARRHARAAFLITASIAGNRVAIVDAVANLDADDHGQIANALESLESAIRTPAVRHLTRLWEDGTPSTIADGLDVRVLLEDPDDFIRRCASLVLGRKEGVEPMEDLDILSSIERLISLRRVPIFATLEPAELNDLAERAEEHVFTDGEVIAYEGEMGDRLHVILSGSVKVVRARSEDPITVRGQGDVVGEIAILSRGPRIASLVASGDVRTISLAREEFEAIVRERPDVGLSVMAVVARRLAAATRDPSGETVSTGGDRA